MKKMVKILLILLGVLILFLFFISIPMFPKEPLVQLDQQVLLVYFEHTGQGGSYQTTIFNNGTMTCDWGDVIGINIPSQKLSPQELQTITQWINNKQFSKVRYSLLKKFVFNTGGLVRTCLDCGGHREMYINQNGRTLLIHKSHPDYEEPSNQAIVITNIINSIIQPRVEECFRRTEELINHQI